ncbi:MAG: molybdopterin molybdenumtransferase MoeA [Burkholderiales bacterium]|nr:MAG: molybdopterin molybdenumtransferase MoeA [Burkholderiales bacterium]
MNRPALLDFDTALSQLLALAEPSDTRETLPTMDALDRVLAADQVSALDVPPMDNAQMDGWAVRVADLAGGQALPVSQRIPAGASPTALAPGSVARIFTGATVPPGADAVVMQEQAIPEGERVRFETVPPVGEWIRRTGEDIRRGAIVLAAGTRLTPQALGLAASVGLAALPVRPRLRVACFFTGDELAMPGEPLPPGAIYNSNRFVLGALLRRLGCEVIDLGIVPDTLEATRAALRDAARDADLIVTSGGMSVGEEDHVRPALQAEGELRTWQIAIKPGKPLAWGRVRRDAGHAHFIGLPGNPVSSFVTFLLFVRPFLLRLQGAVDVAPRALPMRADFDWPTPDRRREFLRARMNDSGGLDLFPNQGSAVMTSTVWADGLIDTPPSQPIRRGDTVRFLPYGGLM